MIDLKNIDVTFHVDGKDIHAVDDVTLSVDKGDVFGVVGYSGAGKSTLVRTINLLQRPSRGQVIVNGEDYTALSKSELNERRKKIGMVFQHFNLMNQRTVYGNVAYALRDSDLSDEEKDKKITELLTLVGLEERRNSYPSQLSGGQKQRVGIARALANDPEILLCDEATSALDPRTTEQILELLSYLNEELGITIVIITHEMDVVKQICNKVAVMEDGRVIEQGDVVQIFTKPQEELTQEFIRTASHIDQSLDNLISHPAIVEFSKDQDLILLSFTGEATGQPLIATLYSKFGASANILYASVDVLNETPVGQLVILLDGPEDSRRNAISYILDEGVEVYHLDVVENEGQKEIQVVSNLDKGGRNS